MLKLVFVIVGFVFLFLMGAMHEQVHVEIFKIYGIESTVNYFDSDVWGMSVTPESNCPSDSCKLAHNINEIVGYTLVPFYVMIMSGLWIIMMKMEDRK